VPFDKPVRVRGEEFSTTPSDRATSKRYKPACASTFELDAGSAAKYISGGGPVFGSILQFFCLPWKGSRLLLARVRLFPMVAIDSVTDLPMVNVENKLPCLILAQHISRRVLMPRLPPDKTLASQLSKLESTVRNLNTKVRRQVQLTAIERNTRACDAAEADLTRVKQQIEQQEHLRLVLGSTLADIIE